MYYVEFAKEHCLYCNHHGHCPKHTNMLEELHQKSGSESHEDSEPDMCCGGTCVRKLCFIHGNPDEPTEPTKP